MRAIFLDRDGVICHNRQDHIKSWDEFQFLPGAKASLAALSRVGLPVIVVTNQAVIGRGLVPAQMVEEIHRRMVEEVAGYGGRIDRVIYCPHRPEDGCNCRKPRPGMLLQAAREMDLDLSGSYMVGDAVTDTIAGLEAGCRSFLVLTGRGFQQLVPTLQSTWGKVTIARNLKAVTLHILRAELDMANEAGGWGCPPPRRPVSFAGNL